MATLRLIVSNPAWDMATNVKHWMSEIVYDLSRMSRQYLKLRRNRFVPHYFLFLIYTILSSDNSGLKCWQPVQTNYKQKREKHTWNVLTSLWNPSVKVRSTPVNVHVSRFVTILTQKHLNLTPLLFRLGYLINCPFIFGRRFIGRT
jgi:hypothetical protein